MKRLSQYNDLIDFLGPDSVFLFFLWGRQKETHSSEKCRTDKDEIMGEQEESNFDVRAALRKKEKLWKMCPYLPFPLFYKLKSSNESKHHSHYHLMRDCAQKDIHIDRTD